MRLIPYDTPMNSHTFEVEIKSLLGDKAKAETLTNRMKALDPGLQELGSHRQLNHYFTGGELAKLQDTVRDMLSGDDVRRLEDVASRAMKFSVRTRDADGKVLLVVKASVDDTTSANGTARLEYEAAANGTLDELDERVLKAGFTYEAKWSRERSEYKLKDVNVSIDRNAGYGYVAEFEKIEESVDHVDEAKAFLRGLMKELGVEELPQDRLERMFAYYNAHWPEYYGTENIFTIE